MSLIRNQFSDGIKKNDCRLLHVSIEVPPLLNPQIMCSAGTVEKVAVFMTTINTADNQDNRVRVCHCGGSSQRLEPA
jgi:hypothetical protein